MGDYVGIIPLEEYMYIDGIEGDSPEEAMENLKEMIKNNEVESVVVEFVEYGPKGSDTWVVEKK